MPDGHGLRSRTRDLFSKGYRKNGVIPLTDFLRVYKIGDYVDIKVNSAVHAGMPHKWYHGKTGVIWNITKRSVGVEVNKQVSRSIAATAPLRGCANPRAALQCNIGPVIPNAAQRAWCPGAVSRSETGASSLTAVNISCISSASLLSFRKAR